jgi:hypothetical protein
MTFFSPTYPANFNILPYNSFAFENTSLTQQLIIWQLCKRLVDIASFLANNLTLNNSLNSGLYP